MPRNISDDQGPAKPELGIIKKTPPGQVPSRNVTDGEVASIKPIIPHKGMGIE